MRFEKKRIVTALLCLLMLSFIISIAFIHKSKSSAFTEASADSPETIADTSASEGDLQSSSESASASEGDLQAPSEGASASEGDLPAPSESAPASEGDLQSSSESTSASEDNSQTPSGTPIPSATPEIIVERLDSEKTMYAASPVNVRTGPSTDYELCGYLNTADAVTVRGNADTGWYLIFYKEQECFVSNKYLQDTPPAVSSENISNNVQTASANTEGAPASSVPAQSAPAQPAPTAAPAKVVASTIFVGDSRFVQMHEAVGDTGVTWICENAKGYNWFVENAIPRIDNLVGNGTKILINLGVNDTKHADNYINMVNGKAAEWTGKGAIVYYASVNPCWENPYVTNDEVISFNSKLSANLVGINWIDSYTYLTENGYRLVDGLHYSDDTYAVIYNYFITCIQ